MENDYNPKRVYTLEELKAEWLDSQDPRPFWEFLDLTETQFEAWMKSINVVKSIIQEKDTK